MRTSLLRRLPYILPLFLVACATLFGLGPPVDRPRAPHGRHIKAEVECVACHETIYDAVDLTSMDLPKEKKCYECHKEEKANKDCKFCHQVPDDPRTFTPRERHLTFDHKKHLENEDIGDDCRRCHKDLPEPGQLDGLTPKMAVCTGCHEHEEHYDNGECDRCHPDLTQYALKPISRFEHKGDYLHTHKNIARSRPDTCGTCHDQQFCADCHARTVATRIEFKMPDRYDRQMIHRGDWIGRHMIEEKRDPMMCERCHASSFCSDCHTRAGVTPVSDQSLNPHGAGINDRSSREFHGAQARRDIVACAACHDQGAQSNCVQCHRVGGVGGTPHPASWTLRHPHEEISQNAMCLVCHR